MNGRSFTTAINRISSLPVFSPSQAEAVSGAEPQAIWVPKNGACQSDF